MKILFFDTWLKGVANFNRLMPEIKKLNNIEVKMLHVGSWKEMQDSMIHEHDGFISYDISYYHSKSIYKVLKKERPDVVVLLNLHYLLDKSIIIFCKKLGIKSVYLSHGRLSTTNDSKIGQFLKEDLKNNFRSKVRRDTINILYNYAISTLITGRPGRFISSILKMLNDPLSMTLNSKFNDELDADVKMVYYESDKKSMVENRGFDGDDIFVVGNPELDILMDKEVQKRETFCAMNKLSNKPYLLYLDDGFVQSRLIDEVDWKNHLAEIAHIANKSGLSMVIKLHPRTPIDKYIQFFEENNIRAFGKDVDFMNLIAHCHTACSLVSTTISYALVQYKRVLSPRWGCVSHFPHNYPDNVIHYSLTPKDFLIWLNENKNTIIDKNYIIENIGIPEGHAIETIVKNIVQESNVKK